MLIATSLIAIKGAGTTGVFDSVISSTLEETAHSAVAAELSQSQMFDVNSLTGNVGAASKLIKTGTLATIQDSSLVAYQTVDTSALDSEEDVNGIRTYEVQEGDALSNIAFDYSLNIQTLIAANNLKNINALKPGTLLKIPPIDGVVHIVKKGDTVSSLAQKYKAEGDKIISFNDLPLAGDLQIGEELVIPNGVPPAKTVAIVRRPVVNAKSFAALPKFEGFFITPATCIITQRAHIRNGYDCANKAGTPIYAAASGTVNLAQNSNYAGYGKTVRITHAGGLETLYGHFSKIVVVPGETVAQGQFIGYMGNTGRSTGPHLHYEVHGAYNNLAPYKLGGHVIAKQ